MKTAASVQIRAISEYKLSEIENAVDRWFSGIKSSKFKRSKRVLIKPNMLGAYLPSRAVTTHPIVVEAIIRYFLGKNKEVWVGDSPGGTVSVSRVWELCGFQDLADRYPIKLVNLSTHPYRTVESNGHSLKISNALYECGIVINVAKYKTHSLMAYTGALKNLYGLVPGMVKSEYHRLHPDTRGFADLLLAVYLAARNKISYTIIDGITGMDGAGPSAGKVQNFGLLMGSESVSALDYVASKMMGFQIKDIPYLQPALVKDGILPSQISVPRSFYNYQLDADIALVKLGKEGLKYLPPIVSKTFKKVYYHYPQVSDRCIKCGVCVRSCPVQAIAWRENGYPMVMRDECIKCMCCHELCPIQAIDIHKSFVARRFMK